ncbi:PEP-CTERM sorting domain-containing protein [Pseudoduganella sp. LjRoot289]|uniref:EDSAP-1 family PEP-CTERM protein n=1 Tax=Pseudoduganella sp. LjRoot289 TaxID=3342314 RepID=UPI003ED096EE
MNIVKRGFLQTTLAASLALAAVVPAHANTFASSILNISNFRLLDSTGTAFSTTDFSRLTGTNDAHATAQLNGVFANDADSRSILNPVPPNMAQQCVGTCPPVPPDTYTPIAGIPPVLTTYGHADQRLTGASIIIGATPAGANASTRADASTAVNAVASGNSDVGTSTTFAFTLGSADAMTIAFDANPYTRALVTPGSGPTSNANARLSWSLRIVEIATGANVLTFSPDYLNGDSNVSATDGAPNDLIYAPGSQFFTATTPLLVAGVAYQLTIQHNSLANALQQELPEPGTLAILAAGLLSMSLLSRRRQS